MSSQTSRNTVCTARDASVNDTSTSILILAKNLSQYTSSANYTKGQRCMMRLTDGIGARNKVAVDSNTNLISYQALPHPVGLMRNGQTLFLFNCCVHPGKREFFRKSKSMFSVFESTWNLDRHSSMAWTLDPPSFVPFLAGIYGNAKIHERIHFVLFTPFLTNIEHGWAGTMKFSFEPDENLWSSSSCYKRVTTEGLWSLKQVIDLSQCCEFRGTRFVDPHHRNPCCFPGPDLKLVKTLSFVGPKADLPETGTFFHAGSAPQDGGFRKAPPQHGFPNFWTASVWSCCCACCMYTFWTILSHYRPKNASWIFFQYTDTDGPLSVSVYWFQYTAVFFFQYTSLSNSEGPTAGLCVSHRIRAHDVRPRSVHSQCCVKRGLLSPKGPAVPTQPTAKARLLRRAFCRRAPPTGHLRDRAD